MSGVRILSVEDEAPLRQSLAVLLRAKGHGLLEGPCKVMGSTLGVDDDVLAVLMRGEGRLVPRDELVDNVMVKLRAAIEPEPDRPRHLITVRGRGFRLDRGDGV